MGLISLVTKCNTLDGWMESVMMEHICDALVHCNTISLSASVSCIISRAELIESSHTSSKDGWIVQVTRSKCSLHHWELLELF